MRRRYYSDDDSFSEAISAILIFYFLYLVYQYFTNRANFWRWLIYGFIFVVIVVVGISRWRRWGDNIKWKRIKKLIEEVRSVGQEEYIINFINRFGLEGKNS